jgi:hypothetical protein
MRLENTVTGGRSACITPVYALLLCSDSICVYEARKPIANHEPPNGYFDDKYALVARYAINLFPVGPVEVYVRSVEGHFGNFYGAHVIRIPAQSA